MVNPKPNINLGAEHGGVEICVVGTRRARTVTVGETDVKIGNAGGLTGAGARVKRVCSRDTLRVDQ